jgi:hypothetical protein
VDRFPKNTQISNLKKMRPAEPELFHADGRSERHEKGNEASRNFANSPKVRSSLEY